MSALNRAATSAVLALLVALPVAAGDAAETPILPPAPPWDGASRSLLAAADDPWITPAEATGLVASPSYEETVAWLQRLAAAAPEVELTSIGRSSEGRELWLVVATADGVFTPQALHRSGKPILFAQAGIHAGEIDGKDAGLMLLRDLTVGGTKRALLEQAHFLFVPIFNVDGHERRSPFGRINQRGPREMGWRTNARNLNLNRDYAKLDTPEMRAMIGALNRWQPDLYLDLHVTDGVDYQYDVTFGWSGRQGYSPAIATWLDDVLRPAVSEHLAAAGHVPGPLIFAADNESVEGGLFDWSAAQPRFSDGYGGLRHLPTVLVENHSLKPYDQRVLGTYLLLESALRVLGERGDELRRAVAEDRARRPQEVPLAWRVPEGEAAETVPFKGIAARRVASPASGGERVEWTGEPVDLEVAVFRPTEVAASVRRPRAYWIPPAWGEVIERLALHGIEMERIAAPRTLEVEMYRLEEPRLDPQPFEGHARVLARPVVERRQETFPAGSVRVPTDQPLGDLAVALLEPASPDSFFQWGFFLEILQRTEYFEAYVMAPMAEAMLRQDPELEAAFNKRLAEDPDFAADPRARLRWFYERTPFFDSRWRLYPVARE
ncbi:MAG: carboxypeptidase [Acidobacteria bacterium]|nr:MAG: carboxypeptidase [Acidobacteriota bacterium]